METDKDELSLENVKGGAAIEAFNIRMAEVLENLADPNTGTGKREIALKVSFTPDKNNRQIVNIAIDCKSNLVPDKTITTVAVLSSDALFELRSMEQKEMFPAEKPENVRDFKSAAAGEREV